LKENSKEKNIIVLSSERSLIETFCTILKSLKPDFISGFNDNSFDWIVMINRAKVHELYKDLMDSLQLEFHLT